MRVSRHGIHLDVDGRGIAFYEFRKPRTYTDTPSEIKRDHTIIATLAGLIAQQKFYPECSRLGASDDVNIVDMLSSEMAEEEFFGGAFSTADIDLRREAEELVERFWPAIQAVACALWDTPETQRDFREPEPNWSPLKMEKRLDGAHLVSILARFEIRASIWDAGAVAD